MKGEAWNKTFVNGKWWVDQCGWGRRFDTEQAADGHIAAMQAEESWRKNLREKIKTKGLTPVLVSARLV